jgi:hypothetical protein
MRGKVNREQGRVSRPGNDEGASEVVGIILLVSMIVLAFGIVSLVLVSQPQKTQIPEISAVIGNVTNATTGQNVVYITHTGGDSLKRGQYLVFVNYIDRTSQITGSGTMDWNVGETLVVPMGNETPMLVQIYYQGPTESDLLVEYTLQPGVIFTYTPTSIPTTSPTTTLTTSPTTTETTFPTTTVTTSPIPTPTPIPMCGSISGIKWNDMNGNGVQDDGEPGIANWEMKCYYKQGGTWVLVGTTRTDNNGYYIFTGLQYSQSAEQYYVQETLQFGWIPTQPTSGQSDKKTLNPSHCYEINVSFGNRQG